MNNDNKNIAKVVFYQDENTKKILTCLFYTDGTPKVVSYEKGLTYAVQIAAKTGMKTTEELKELITDTNFPYIYAIPKNTLRKNWYNFIKNSQQKESSNEIGQNNKEKNNNKSLITKISKIKNVKSVKKANKFFGPTLKYLYKKGIAISTAFILLVTGIGSSFKDTNAEKINNKKAKTRTESNNNNYNNTVDNIYTKSIDNYYNQKTNNAYNNYDFNRLLSTTTNKKQYNIMKRIGNYLNHFNGTFAESYLENEKNIKAALSWEESVALSLAFNDYTRKQIQAIFNGYETDATDLNNAYKTAILQLTSAYIIENRTQPVNLYKMLENPDEQAFVKKYEELFLQCKEAKGQDQIDKVKFLYNELFKDFPISDDIREEGIAHADPRNNLTPYKLAITPIVAASEAMFQSLAIDHTLSNKAIAYFNDLGLCNIADNKFDQAMYISITNDEDKNIPTYKQFRKAKIKELKATNRYVMTDNNRDLSQLESFKNWVNPPSSKNINSSNNGGVFYTTDTYQETSTTTENSTSYYTETTTEETSNRNEAVSRVGEEAVSKAEEAVDEQIRKENEKAKRKGILKAEKRAKKEQIKENKKAKKNEKQVAEDNKDFQEKINKENQEIENNKNSTNKNNINESDFGDHGVEFDDEHNNNGNLNNSVENITTDGNQADQQLPDPSQTGAEFDSQAIDNLADGSIQPEEVIEEYIPFSESDTTQYTPAEEITPQDTYIYDTTNVGDESIQQQEVESEEYIPPKTEDTTNYEAQLEAFVDQYVEDMANAEGQIDDDTFVYVK